MEQGSTFRVSILGYREDDTWVAIALEMDIRGYGDTPEAARKDLLEMLAAQVSYAVQSGHPESVWKRAANEYWRMFEDARRSEFVAQVSGMLRPLDRTAEMIPLPEIPQRQWAGAGA